MSKKVSLFIIIFVLIASGCASTHIEDPTGRSSLSEAYSGPFPCCFHQEAEYPGGPKAMMKFINDNLRYPEEVVPRKGRVIVKFFIDTLGNVCNPTVIKGISAPYDEEALRVVSSFPKFTPGQKDGKKVRTAMNVPIIFKDCTQNSE